MLAAAAVQGSRGVEVLAAGWRRRGGEGGGVLFCGWGQRGGGGGGVCFFRSSKTVPAAAKIRGVLGLCITSPPSLNMVFFHPAS